MTTPKRALIGASLIAILTVAAAEAMAQDTAPVPPLERLAVSQGQPPAAPAPQLPPPGAPAPMTFVPADGVAPEVAPAPPPAEAPAIPSVGTTDLKQIDEMADLNAQKARLQALFEVEQIQAKRNELKISIDAAKEKIEEERQRRQEARDKAKRDREAEEARAKDEEEARRKAQADEEARRANNPLGLGGGPRAGGVPLPSGVIGLPPKALDVVPRQGVPPAAVKKEEPAPAPVVQDNLAELPTVSLVSSANGPRQATLHLLFGQTKHFVKGDEIPGGYVISSITRDGVVKVVSTRTNNEYELRSGRGGPLIGGGDAAAAGGRPARR